MNFPQKALRAHIASLLLVLLGTPLAAMGPIPVKVIGGVLILAGLALSFLYIKCPYCGRLGDYRRATFCHHCGSDLRDDTLSIHAESPHRPADGSPPATLDGNRVLFWAWSGKTPFFEMRLLNRSVDVPIHGLAICMEENSDNVHRLFCGKQWDVESVTSCESLQDALTAPLQHVDIDEVRWQPVQPET